MQEELVNYLQKTYQPQVIILHGSRACDMSRTHSDWDFILLYSGELPEIPTREFYKDEHIEIYAKGIPVQDIFDTFGTKLSNVQLLLDTDNLGLELLFEAQKVYKNGIRWDKQKIHENKLWMLGRLDGMRDTVAQPELFTKYFSDFYLRLHNYWYVILHNEYSKPIYLAHKDIQTRDVYYYDMLIEISKPTTIVENKLIIAEKLFKHLFD